MLHARLPEVLPAYEAALEQSIQLDLNTLGSYFHRRVLEDLAVDLATMRENTRPEQDAESLRLIRDYVLPASLQIEAEFDDLAAALILWEPDKIHLGGERPLGSTLLDCISVFLCIRLCTHDRQIP